MANDAHENCRLMACDRPAMANGYCRLHYIQYWQQIKGRRRLIEFVRMRRMQEALVRDRIEGKKKVTYVEQFKKDERLDESDLAHLMREMNAPEPPKLTRD
ncbi:hypothetical protein K8I61_20005 [bacterium]|nr:hypothetical protein [bacterium]